MWRQRSRAIWLKNGDKNIKKIHGKENNRKKVSQIKKFKGEEGSWWSSQEMLRKLSHTTSRIRSLLQLRQICINFVR